MFNKILIANRGEIACRVIRTCRELGIRTVAVYSSADADAQHVRQADEAYCIGGPTPAESYLRGDAIIEVATRAGAQAIHPGYGFLSENADFADGVESAGMAFIGPKAASMRKMGSKAGAKDLMQAAGVPVVPGYTGEEQAPAHLHAEADRIGYPLMIKAAHGGGGKGMRIVRESGEFLSSLESCQREAKNAFGRDRVLLERYVQQPRHIEFQIFGDDFGNAIHLGERECSAQRRYQKVLEEAPSPFLTPQLRERMGEAAVMAARAIDYVNAGTVEFIVGQDTDGNPADFYFMEINTRLQVEHPVTELVTGLDLVAWQLQVAAGEPLPLAQDRIERHGHAIEVRLYAEDPEAGFLPGSGKLERLRLPVTGRHVRIDSGVIQGDTVTIFYDPMIAKLIVHDIDRPRALARMRDALAQCAISGPKSNIPFLERLVRHPTVVAGTIDTGYLDRHLEEFIPADDEIDTDLLLAATVARLLGQERNARASAENSSDPGSPWAIADGWRLGHGSLRSLAFGHRERRIEISASGSDGDYRVTTGDGAHDVTGARLAGGALSLRIGGRARRFQVLGQDMPGHDMLDQHVSDQDHAAIVIHDGTQRLRLQPMAMYRHQDSGAGAGADNVVAPMPGRVVVVKASVGDVVQADQEVMVIEAMKMELSLKAPRDGTVAEVRTRAGEFVDADAVLLALEPVE